MRKLDKKLAYHMTTRGTVNFMTKRPLAVSFELTHSCSCNCRNCEHGGKLSEGDRLTADQYGTL